MERIKKIILKILKWSGISVASALFLMFIIPVLFPGTVSEQVKLFANKHLAGKLDYKKTHLTFFRHFPSLTVSVDGFLLKGSIDMVREMATAAKNVNMKPIYPSLEDGGIVNLRDVEVKNLKMLSTVGDNIGAKAFNDPDMKGVNIETHIKNNLIHVDKFTFKVSILRPTISGTTSFNGLLDLKIRDHRFSGGGNRYA